VTLTLDRVILHTFVHRSLTSTYIPNFIEIEETFCGQTDVAYVLRTYVRTDGRTFETDFIRSTLKSLPKMMKQVRLSQLGHIIKIIQYVDEIPS